MSISPFHQPHVRYFCTAIHSKVNVSVNSLPKAVALFGLMAVKGVHEYFILHLLA
jgi:hypothetical protein